MDYFAQQLINGLVLGSIYGLIAIGYTMVYGIVGMINFAHGDIFMIGGFIALITFLLLISTGLTAIPVILLIVLLVSMAITALYGWTIERIAYRPLRHSFRLAPMLSAIGMSFVLTNYSQVAQGARVKPIPPLITGGYTLHESADGFVIQLSNIQIMVVVTTIVLLAIFTWLVSRTRLGRDMRACEQDQTMAALLGVNVDRTISMTFVIGAALAAVAGLMYLLYYGAGRFLHGLRRRHQGVHRCRARRHRLAAGRDARGARDRADRDVLVGLFLGRVQGRRRLLDPDRRADLHADRPARPPRSRKSLTVARVKTPSINTAKAPSGIPALLKTACFNALVALVLFSLMIGIRTEAGSDGQLTYWTRFGDLASIVAAVFGGSIVIELLRQWIGPTAGAEKLVPPALQSGMSFVGRYLAPALLIFTLLVPVIFYDQRYILDLAILVLTYVMLGWGLNVVVGLAGLLDLGYVAFYAVGAYSYALLATNFGWSFWVCLPLAGILAAFWGVLLGFPVLRLRGDYLAIVTLAFGEIIRMVIINWQDLTGGPNGVSSIPRPSFFGIPLDNSDNGLAAKLGIEYSPTHRIVFLFYLILALALLTNWVTIRLRRLPIGRAWEALREDEVACRALGINTTTTKLTAFATGAMFGGFAGAFFATRQGFISPESFTFQESALVLAIVVLGGMGSQLGVALAALAMIGGFELFRGLENYRMLVFGMAMVLIMIWRPRGLIGHRAPTVYLTKAQAISSDLVKEGHG
ncbi:ABC-type branched-subunit amino acid transport system permease subunit [Bradyrhizobium sp. LB7.2]